MIVAHLDLDAFFAAVEELEDPELRRVPLVVGGDPHSRGVVSTASYVARRFGVVSAMSCAEALRRCPHAVFVRPRGIPLPGVLARGLDDRARDRALGRAGRNRRGLSRPGRARSRVRRRAGACRGGAGGRQGAHEAFVLARRRHLEGRGQGRLRPTQAGRAHGRAARPRGGVPRAVPDPRAPGDRPPSGARLTAAGVETIGASPRSATRSSERPPRQGRPGRARTGPRDRPKGARGLERADLDLERGDIRAGRRRRGAAARRASTHGVRPRAPSRRARAGSAHRRHEAPLPDFSIRTRSTSLSAGTDDAGRIGELACSLLDRALRDRPGPLRLVGVGLSGLTDHAQLELALKRVRPMEGFHHAAAVRVRFAETDAQGVAHNSNYLVWFEVARVEFLERVAGGYSGSGTKGSSRSSSRRTSGSSRLPCSTTGCWSTHAVSTPAARGSGSSTQSSGPAS